MHIEILVEDRSGKEMLDILVPKLIDESRNTYRINNFSGLGRLPEKQPSPEKLKNNKLLDSLPRLLKAYGKEYARREDHSPATVVVVCDLDDKCLKEFRKQLLNVLDQCDPKPDTRFCFAVEEGEAWLLGDIKAIKRAYPYADDGVLNSYENDSICNTWEVLADAVFSGRGKRGSRLRYPEAGKEKCRWAREIAVHMDVEHNLSPSFNHFRCKLRSLAEVGMQEE